MKRLAFISWCIGSIGLWLVMVFCIVHFILTHIWYEIPIGFYEITNDLTLWLVRKFKPGYDPGVLQMDDPGLFVLLIATGLISAAVVILAGTLGWRRFSARRAPQESR
ncbi:hypothetical protein [Paraburkholderia acidipaludis]|uniref:hypothetical protein n=1 Tax=Paraburkholderia acidipaludis TaxID=660537 RepID=UPI0012EBE81E|nr:hypothetical protein [Paraburkholderia acidipaludis]